MLKTPLFESVKHDRMVWDPDSKGQYSVRSAYRLGMKKLLDTSHLRVAGNWIDLWHLAVPPKVKNFLWRACRGVIPTRDNLRARGVEELEFAWCENAAESICHVLVTCPKSESTWRSLKLWNGIVHQIQVADTFCYVFFHVLSSLQTEDRRTWAMTLWSLWRSRNQKIWEGVDERPVTIVLRGKTLLEEWEKARNQQVQV